VGINMDSDYLKKLNKAMKALSNPTNLYIAKRLEAGILSTAVMARLIHQKELYDKVSDSQYQQTIIHMAELKEAGIIIQRRQDFSKFIDYEITQIGREALERKGYRNLNNR
jgi:DNA-binding transcriptional ArsR family regulator